MNARQKIVELAYSWLGKNEHDGSFKSIVDIYNSHKPHPRGYKVKYTDEWCAITTSALAIKLGLTNIIPIECSCYYIVKLAKSMGIWVESDIHKPKEGDLILYVWSDSGKGDNTSPADHIGMVVKVNGNNFDVFEGNYSTTGSCKIRKMSVDGRYIRGYICPKYETATAKDIVIEKVEKEEGNTVDITLNILKKGSKGKQVETLQTLLNAKGFWCGSCGVDGEIGADTVKAIKSYQKANRLKVDGCVGSETWTNLLKK